MKLSAIARKIGAETGAAGDLDIANINSPESAGSNDITFLSNPKYRAKIESSAAAAVIVKKGESIPGKICLEVQDPYLGYALTAQLFENTVPIFGTGVSPHAIVDKTAKIGESVSIGPGSIIGANAVIGAHTRIDARCVIEKDVKIGEQCRIDSGAIIRWGCEIGNRVFIQSNAVIGSDGFGNARLSDGSWERIPCLGAVVIEDGAEIGAGAMVDRGNLDSTHIGKGVKLDNLVHIAHNVIIGENSVMAAQTGISGSTHIGKMVIFGGQAGCVGHIDIGDGAFIGAKSGISKSVDPGAKITGYPARDFMTMRRIEAAQTQLPSLLKEIKQLKEEIVQIKKSLQ